MSKHKPASVSELDYDAFERLILAAPKMYELIATGVRFLQSVRQYHPLSAAEDKWEEQARELLAEIEGGGE